MKIYSVLIEDDDLEYFPKKTFTPNLYFLDPSLLM